MGIFDIEYGWTHEILDLVDVTISRSISLLEQNKDGEWQERSASFVDDETFENSGQLKYSGVTRTIIGKARYSDFMDQMILGVPEVKEEALKDDESRIDAIEVQIRGVSDADRESLLGKGRIRYLEANEYFDERVHVSVFIAEDHFEEICAAAAEPDATFQIGLNLKCWRFLGPIGDTKIYFKADGWDPAELAFITVNRQTAFDKQNDEDEE